MREIDSIIMGRRCGYRALAFLCLSGLMAVARKGRDLGLGERIGLCDEG